MSDLTNFTDEGIKNLTNLREFCCKFISIFTDEGLKHLINLQIIKY